MNLEPALQQKLLQIARYCIVHRVSSYVDRNIPEPLRVIASCFVTLHLNHQLRGCIGSLNPSMPLYMDVAEHAFGAAFRDSRFMPVEDSEMDDLKIHISVLFNFQKMHCPTEQSLLDRLQVKRDGLVIEFKQHRATFLPSVWDSIEDKKTFVHKLKVKAGLSENFWSDKMACQTYQVCDMKE